MRSTKLDRKFFNRPTLTVSKDLLGKFIVRRHRGRLIRGVINETEAYLGPQDRAAHSYLHPDRAPQKWHPKFHQLIARHYKEDPRQHFERWARAMAKITPRTIAEYLEGGHIYIYMVYGMYWQLNLSTAGEGIPECVLIRSVIPVRETGPRRYAIEEKRIKEANGPGKLCAYLKLDGSFYAEDVARSDRVWLEDSGIAVPPRDIQRGPRVGIDYAGKEWAAKPWRFLVRPEKIAKHPLFS